MRFLADPATHSVDRVEHIVTHISHVFIAGDRTYKLKRAVARSFVDYSTLQKRREMCEREIAINSAYAPEIYKGVTAISKSPGGYEIGGDGPAVEYVVEMATFDPDQAFDRLAQRGTLAPGYIRQLADAIAQAHCNAEKRPASGGERAFQEIVRGLVGSIRASPSGPALKEPLADWERDVSESLGRHGASMEARRRHGFVRRCHGDLHLANICLFEGKPTLFDAIEFNEEIASIDVLYDIAFTLMDLLYRGQREAANQLLCRYINLTRDTSGLRLLPAFISVRAAVRAMTATGKPEDGAATDEARKRLVFAIRALHAPHRPRLIAIGGFSGSGKSTIAARVAPQLPGILGALVLRSDVYRKRLFGVAPEDRLGKEAYSDDISERVYATVLKDAGRALRNGVPVILDATFTSPSAAGPLRRLAARCGVEFTGLWLHVPLDELQRRIGNRSGDASDATAEIAAGQWQAMPEPPEGFEVVDGVGQPDAVASAAMRRLT